MTTICGLITTWLLVGVLKYDTTSKQGNFDIDFWNRLCEKEWQIAFKAFVLGGLFFMLSLIQGSWVLYNDHEYGVVASVIVTVICVSCVVFWYLRVYSKWADTLQKVTYSSIMRCVCVCVCVYCSYYLNCFAGDLFFSE